MNHCKTEKEFKLEEIAVELPASALRYIKKHCSTEEFGSVEHQVLSIARYATMHHASSMYSGSALKNMKEIIRVLDEHGYIRHDLGKTLRLLRLYADVFERGGGRPGNLISFGHNVISAYDDTYETHDGPSAEQVALVRKHIEKVLTPEEARVIEGYYLDDEQIPFAEMAKRLDVKYTTIITWRRQGLRKLSRAGERYCVYNGEDYETVFVPFMPPLFDVSETDARARAEAMLETWKKSGASNDRKLLAKELTPALRYTGSSGQVWALRICREAKLDI